MKFTIKRSDAAEAVKKCMSVAGKGRTLPILSCILIDAKDGEVTMTASDLDRWVICRVPAEVKESGGACLAGRLLSGIFSSGESASVEVNAKMKAIIDCGGSITRTSALAADEMPAVPNVGAGEGITMDASAWIEAFLNVSWAASTEVGRTNVQGTLIVPDGESLVFVATDGRRLCKTVADCKGVLESSISVPADTMAAINSIAGNGGELTIHAVSGMVMASCGNDVITSKLIEEYYPNYKAVIPDYSGQKTTKVRIPSKAFVEKLDRVAMVSTQDSDSVTLDISTGIVAMSAKSKDGDATSSIEVMVDGNPVVAAFRGGFLGQPFRKWDASEIEMEIIDGMSPMVLTSGDTICVIMPMRVQ